MLIKTPGLTVKYYDLLNGFEKVEELATLYDKYHSAWNSLIQNI